MIFIEILKIIFLDNEIYLYVDRKIADNVLDFWKETLDIFKLQHKKIKLNAWVLVAVKVLKGAEYNVSDIKNKFIVNFYSKYDLIEINGFIRECLTKITLLSGVVWLHASAFQLNNKTYLILGEKNTGKTTWLLNFILNHNAYFISNDQIPILIKNNKLVTIGWRPDIKVRPSTLKLLNIQCDDTVVDRYLIHVSDKGDYIDLADFSEKYKYFVSFLQVQSIKKLMNQKVQIDEIIYLKKNSKNIWGEIWKDKENLIPSYMEKWNLIIPYWRKRVTESSVSESAKNMEKLIIKKLKEIPVKVVEKNVNLQQMINILESE